jgi:hypothetical protein
MQYLQLQAVFPQKGVRILAICGFFFALFILPSGFADATHEYCGNTDVPQSLVSSSGDSYGQSSYYRQSGYYAQAGYYKQSGYYSQATYYSQSAYYAQSAYITGVDINVEPPLVKPGEDAVVSWNPGNATSCTLSGPNFTQTSPTSGTATNITGETTYTLTCTHFEQTYTQTVKVKVVPQIEET